MLINVIHDHSNNLFNLKTHRHLPRPRWSGDQTKQKVRPAVKQDANPRNKRCFLQPIQIDIRYLWDIYRIHIRYIPDTNKFENDGFKVESQNCGSSNVKTGTPPSLKKWKPNLSKLICGFVNSMIYFCVNICYMHFLRVLHCLTYWPCFWVLWCSMVLNGAQCCWGKWMCWTLHRGRSSLGKYNSSDTRTQVPSSTPWTCHWKHVKTRWRHGDFQHPTCLVVKYLEHKGNQTISNIEPQSFATENVTRPCHGHEMSLPRQWNPRGLCSWGQDPHDLWRILSPRNLWCEKSVKSIDQNISKYCTAWWF